MSTASVRSLFWARRADLDAVRRLFESVVPVWLGHWAPPQHHSAPEAIEVTALTPPDVPEGWPWTDALWHCSLEGRRALGAMLLGQGAQPEMAAPDSVWMEALLDEALADLLRRLVNGFGGDRGLLSAVSPPSLAQAYAGLVLVKAPRWGLSWLLQPAAYRHLNALPGGAGAPSGRQVSSIVALTTALARSRLTLSIGLGETHASVDDLTALRAGDVIRFPAQVSDPLPVLLAGQDSALRADIGTHGTVRRIKLASPLSAPAAPAEPAVATKPPVAKPTATNLPSFNLMKKP